MALVCAAQLQHYLGDADSATALLGRAIAMTQSRRSAWPFLGWSAHGTRVGELLQRTSSTTSGWGAELRTDRAERPSITTMFMPAVATKRELASVPERRVEPVLSPREHEVLNELARGATYSDIAASLFVSENTVKTHISSLYSKLSVGRRSEALAVARKMHLL
jgi:DNA-binding NarL/FixJ family response regulator